MSLRPVRVTRTAYMMPPTIIEGRFHGFGLNIPYQEHDGTMFQYTVAFVEQSDGSIIEAHPQEIVFLDVENPEPVPQAPASAAPSLCWDCGGDLEQKSRIGYNNTDHIPF